MVFSLHHLVYDYDDDDDDDNNNDDDLGALITLLSVEELNHKGAAFIAQQD